MIRISIFEWYIAVSQNNKIFLIKNEKLLLLPTFRNYCFNQSYDSLPKYRPFFSHSASSLLSIASHARIYQDGGTKVCVVSISCQLTQSYAPATKTRGSFVTLVLSSKYLPLQFQLAPSSYKSKVWKDFGFKVFYDGQGVRHFSLYCCVIFYHLLIVINGN